jgi:glycosyltransferase involved in cell wall biosynthesis
MTSQTQPQALEPPSGDVRSEMSLEGLQGMRLLISAYACAPNLGSEHACGWNWTAQVARLGCEVTALVSSAHRTAVLAAAEKDPALRRIRWVFPEIVSWPLQQGQEPVWERTYNLLWQREALQVARALHRERPFDLVHHLTWAGVRAPTFLGGLGAPLIIGPVGGGETSPRKLRDRFSLRGRVLEGVRDLSNATIELNPIVRQGLRHAGVIFARTPDTRNLLSPGLRAKTYVQMELGVTQAQIDAPRPARETPRRLLFAGRLLYWKGVHIAIEAMSRLVGRMPDAHLTIVGNGPEEARLKAEVAHRDLGRNITFVSWMPQDQLQRLYQSHDVFVFPSLHDSAGWVVLESLCKGLPVACLNIGGPAEIVTRSSGIVVDTTGLDTSGVAARLADDLNLLLSDPARLSTLSAGAIARAGDFLLHKQVERLYSQARGHLGRSSRRFSTTDPYGRQLGLQA